MAFIFYLWRLPYFFQIAYFSARQTAQGLAAANCRSVIEKKHSVLYMAAARNSPKGGTAVEASVKLAAPMAIQGARTRALTRLAVLSDQSEGRLGAV
jgi:hypothetical protein